MGKKKVIGIILAVVGIVILSFGMILSFYPFDVFMQGVSVTGFEANPAILIIPIIGAIIFIIGILLILYSRK